MNTLLLVVKTARHRYVVRRDELLDIKIVQVDRAPRPDSASASEYLGFELGPLLDPGDRSGAKRQRALIVPMRRRTIALFVDDIETFLEHTSCLPLPGLLRERLQKPWVAGALTLGDDLVLQLDLRAVARSALLSDRESVSI